MRGKLQAVARILPANMDTRILKNAGRDIARYRQRPVFYNRPLAGGDGHLCGLSLKSSGEQ